MNERIEMWKQQVAEDPGNELSRFSLAQAYFAAKAWEEALAQYQAAMGLKPGWMMATIQSGYCLKNLGRIEEAKEMFRQGRELAIAQHHKEPKAEMDEVLEELG